MVAFRAVAHEQEGSADLTLPSQQLLVLHMQEAQHIVHAKLTTELYGEQSLPCVYRS